MSFTTLIHESQVRTENNNIFLIDDTFNEKMKEKYESDFKLRIGKKGYILFFGQQESVYQQNIRTTLGADAICKVILELSKEYNTKFVGSFTYRSYYVNTDISGICYAENNHFISHNFCMDIINNKTNNASDREIITI